MSRADDQTASPAKRLIFATRERVQMVRNRYHAERVAGGVSDETHRELATVALQYRDVLSEHSENEIVAEKWEDSGVDGLETLVGQTRAVEIEAPGRTQNTQTVMRPAVLSVPAEDIYRATKQLDLLALELGFAASTREKTSHTTTDPDDLEALLTARGQTQALENLPARFLNTSEDERESDVDE